MRWSPFRVLVLALALVVPGCLDSFSVFGPDRTEWAYEATGLAALEDLYTGNGVTVAIVDTGLDASHPDLAKANIIGWMDLVNNRPEPYDDNGHGTHVTGIIAANGKLKGGAPGVSLLVYKAISASKGGTDGDVATAIRDATSKGADVICLSLGGGRLPVLGSQTSNAAASAVNRGVFVVAAAGNEGASASDTDTPSDEAGVIAVGAINEARSVASFSNRGATGDPGLIGLTPRTDPNKKPEVVAPGVKITSTWTGGEYRIADGTSQAAPFVCAGLALALEKSPALQRQNGDTVKRVKTAMKASAEPLPGQKTPHDPAAGYGLFRADRMLARL